MTDPSPAIELTPPDISAYRHGNTGVSHAIRFDSGAPGPEVVVNALVHGNELCGAIAIDFLFRIGVRPVRGALTLCFADVAAYHAFDPAQPLASRYLDEDMNRVWAPEVLDGPGESVELARARQLRPIYGRADLLLDLHSMQHDTEPLTLCGRTARARALARELGHPSWIVSDGGHAAGRRLMEYGGFADPHGTRTALLVECGQHWRARTAEVAIQTTLRFLRLAGILDPGLAERHLVRQPQPPPRVVDVTETVTVTSDEGVVFTGDFVGMEIIERRGTLIGFDGPREIRTPYDRCVLIMPSGRARRGQTAVRLGRMAG